jgi:hypothetical protein
VEELLELWTGVSTYDVVSGKKFDLHAAMLWCIHDYPALSTLSGRTTKGYYASIHCDKNPLSRAPRGKTSAIAVLFQRIMLGGEACLLMAALEGGMRWVSLVRKRSLSSLRK